MSAHPQHTAALQQMLAGMPPVAAMMVQVVDDDGRRLRLQAPLSRNVNDKGCAFGGSLAGLMTLACWGLGVLRMRSMGLTADFFVQDSHVRYLAPLWTDLEAEAWLEPDAGWEAFGAQLAARGKARASMAARIVGADGSDAATLQGRFVALRSAAGAS